MKQENYFIRGLIFMVLMLLSSFLTFDSPSNWRENERCNEKRQEHLSASRRRI